MGGGAMMLAQQDETIVLSYVRQPVEDADVVNQAQKRFGLSSGRQPFDGWYLLVGVVAGACLYFFMGAYRGLFLIPLLNMSPLVETGDLLVICFLPCLLVYAVLVLDHRRRANARLAALRARIRPDLDVTVTISDTGISWSSPGLALSLDWQRIADIVARDGRIDFEADTFVGYLPGHAFRNEQEQAAFLERILALWQAARVLKP